MLLLSACRKEEDALSPILQETVNLSDIYGTRLGTASIGEGYRFQDYFDLSENTSRANVDKYRWELGFGTAEPHVILNSAIPGLRLAKSEQDWESTTATEDLFFGWDLATGDLEDMALGDRFDPVYVLNRGLEEDGTALGFLKLQCHFEEGQYHLRTAELDGSNEHELVIDPNADYTYMHLHLTHGIVDVEPMKGDWDIVFTHYLHVYDPETEPFPYQVTGCLLNGTGVTAWESTALSYDEITLESVIDAPFESTRDFIGFDWKYFDFDLGFIVDDARTFVIRDAEGQFFKLKFTGFYDENGEKGHPQFSFQLL